MAEDKKKKSKPHFIKEIPYSHESWLTDAIVGQRGSKDHAHLTLSGAAIWYFRDEQGQEIIKNGSLIPNNTYPLWSDYKQDTSEEPQHPEQSPSENEDNSNSSS